jgi:hypothetical protein
MKITELWSAGGFDEDYSLVSWQTATFRRVVVPPLLWSSFPVLGSFNLKTEAFHTSESSVTLHQSTRRNFPELNAHWSCSSSFRLYIREPNALDVAWGNFLAPFNISLWLEIPMIIFVVSVLLEACHQLHRHFGSCKAERRYQPFLQDSLFQVLCVCSFHIMFVRALCSLFLR